MCLRPDTPEEALPADWRALSKAGLRGFCALPLCCGEQMVGVLTLAWSGSCPVPPSMRRGSTTASALSAPARPAELAALQRLGPLLGFGLLSDEHHSAYALKMARMLSSLSLAATLQAALDAVMSSFRDILRHRCQVDIACTLALASHALPRAAFVVESAAAVFQMAGRSTARHGQHAPGSAPPGATGHPSSMGPAGATAPKCLSIGPGPLGAGSSRGGAASDRLGSGVTGPPLVMQFLSGEWGQTEPLASSAAALHAHLTPLTHTMLASAMQQQQRAAAATAAGSPTSAASVGHTTLGVAQQPRPPAGEPGAPAAAADPAAQLAEGATITGSGAQRHAISGGVMHAGLVVPSCSAHLQDEQLPCRDIVLVQKLLAGCTPVHALALAVWPPLDGPGPAAAAAAAAQHPPSPAPGSGGPATQQAAAASSASAMPTFAAYLTSADPLPAAVLLSLQAEALQLLQLALPALARRVSGSLSVEWNALLEALASTTHSTTHELPGSSPGSGHHLGTAPAPAASGASARRHQVSGQSVSSGEPLSVVMLDGLQPLEMMVSSIQTTLSTPQHQADHGQQERGERMADISGVELLEVIGRGGQGVVFRGTLHSIEAAVKVISNRDRDDAAVGAGAGQQEPQQHSQALGSPEYAASCDEQVLRERKRGLLRDALELAVTSSISHPNIVQMYCFFTNVVVVEYGIQTNRLRLLPSDHESLQQAVLPPTAKKPTPNTVMCMEYCDAGTLKSAAEAGAFRQPGVSAKSGPACPALVPLYTSLLELAMALRHLHARKLVHCDIKPANVLLKSSTRDARGWVCKLSDFGCVRLLSEAGPDARLGFRQPQPLGTVTHMAPEMFLKGQVLDCSVDIYSFGIMMWELIMVAPLYDGSAPRDKLPSMVRRGLRPVFHPLVPTEYRILATACWADDPLRRPTATVLVSTLQRLLQRAHNTLSSSVLSISPMPTSGLNTQHRVSVGRHPPPLNSTRPGISSSGHLGQAPAAPGAMRAMPASAPASAEPGHMAALPLAPEPPVQAHPTRRVAQ